MRSCAARTTVSRPRHLHKLFAISFSSSSEAKVLKNQFDDECKGFLPWLEKKAGAPISSKLYIGKSAFGRSLFASERIQSGDCILRVPFGAQIAADNLLRKVKSSLGNEVGNVSKLAVVLLVEQKTGQESEWAPYIRCLPQVGEIHSTIFWDESELNMIRRSSLYNETIKQQNQIEKDFLTIKKILKHLPEIVGSITLWDFMHACALVTSRAWESAKGVSLIPFADFLNHDGASEAVVIHDDDKRVSEVFADRNYAPNEEVLITYGKFSNATLLLDFGFTVPHNIHDQVEIQINIPHHDSLREKKWEIFQRHRIPAIKDANGFESSGDSFIIKEVKSASGKGKGLPQSLRAFARIMCCTSPQELSDLVIEAVENDGRLARRRLRICSREIQAHEILLSQVTQLIEEYYVSIKLLQHLNPPSTCKRYTLRRKMAQDLLTGELRVLKSASTWLKNYCTNLLQQPY